MFQRQMCLAMCPVVVVFLFAGAVRADEPADAMAKIRKALGEPTNFEFIETPLHDVVEYLENLHGIPVRLDGKAMDESGIGSDTPVTRNLKKISLKSALKLTLLEHDLTFVIADETLFITTFDEVETRLGVRVYPVRDLVTLPDRKKEKHDFDSLTRLVSATLAPNTWEKVGGSGSLSHHSDTLVISQNPDVHAQVEALLAALRELPPLCDAKCGQVTAPVSAPRQGLATQKISKTLGANSSGEFIETPLRDVVEYLKDVHKIEIQIDQRALDDAGIGTDSPVTANYKDISLSSALRHILRPLDLNVVIRDEVLLITAKHAYESYLTTVLYPVFDLLDLPATAELWEVDEAMQQLAEVLTTSIEAESWDEIGGPGSVIPFVNRSVLVISQTGKAHEEISNLLAKLRKVRAKQGPPEKPQKTNVFVKAIYHINIGVAPAKGEEKSGKQKISPTDLEFVIMSVVEPESWKVKGPYIKALPGMLVVRQKRQVLKKLETFLGLMGLNPRTGQFGGGGGGYGPRHGGFSGFFRVAN